MTIGERVRGLRKRKSLAELGKELGVSATQLSKIETDQSKPSFELADKICEKYNVTLDWLMRGIETQPSSKSVAENDNDSAFITISKDEFIALQRKALKQEEEKNAELQKRLEQVKNG